MDFALLRRRLSFNILIHNSLNFNLSVIICMLLAVVIKLRLYARRHTKIRYCSYFRRTSGNPCQQGKIPTQIFKIYSAENAGFEWRHH
jgi:hypothetical protein